MNKPGICLLLSLCAGSALAAEMPMDHSTMPGMHHGSGEAVGHAGMEGMAPDAASPAPQPDVTQPLPTPTAAERAAAFPDVRGHALHDSDLRAYWLLDRLEYQKADAGTALDWDVEGWIGGDINRLWLRSEGERTNGHTESAEFQVLYGHAISPWWTLLGGVRQDFKPQSPQTWATFGVEGEPLSDFDVDATLFLGENHQAGLRLEGEYDLSITSSLILQPRMEANLFSRNDPVRQQGAGLSTLEAGLRLRYEIIPEVAPYIGVNWTKNYGRTADYVREEGDDVEEGRLVVGIRLWY